MSGPFSVFCNPFHCPSGCSDWWLQTDRMGEWGGGASAPRVPCQVDGFFLLPAGANWDHFYKFAHLVHTLICHSALQPNLHVWHLLLRFDTCPLFCLLPLKHALSTSQGFISLITHWWVVYSPGFCHVSLCPFSYQPTPVRRVLCPDIQGPSYLARPAFLYTTSLH